MSHPPSRSPSVASAASHSLASIIGGLGQPRPGLPQNPFDVPVEDFVGPHPSSEADASSSDEEEQEQEEEGEAAAAAAAAAAPKQKGSRKRKPSRGGKKKKKKKAAAGAAGAAAAVPRKPHEPTPAFVSQFKELENVVRQSHGYGGLGLLKNAQAAVTEYRRTQREQREADQRSIQELRALLRAAEQTAAAKDQEIETARADAESKAQEAEKQRAAAEKAEQERIASEQRLAALQALTQQLQPEPPAAAAEAAAMVDNEVDLGGGHSAVYDDGDDSKTDYDEAGPYSFGGAAAAAVPSGLSALHARKKQNTNNPFAFPAAAAASAAAPSFHQGTSQQQHRRLPAAAAAAAAAPVYPYGPGGSGRPSKNPQHAVAAARKAQRAHVENELAAAVGGVEVGAAAAAAAAAAPPPVRVHVPLDKPREADAMAGDASTRLDEAFSDARRDNREVNGFIRALDHAVYVWNTIHESSISGSLDKDSKYAILSSALYFVRRMMQAPGEDPPGPRWIFPQSEFNRVVIYAYTHPDFAMRVLRLFYVLPGQPEGNTTSGRATILPENKAQKNALRLVHNSMKKIVVRPAAKKTKKKKEKKKVKSPFNPVDVVDLISSSSSEEEEEEDDASDDDDSDEEAEEAEEEDQVPSHLAALATKIKQYRAKLPTLALQRGPSAEWSEWAEPCLARIVTLMNGVLLARVRPSKVVPSPAQSSEWTNDLLKHERDLATLVGPLRLGAAVNVELLTWLLVSDDEFRVRWWTMTTLIDTEEPVVTDAFAVRARAQCGVTAGNPIARTAQAKYAFRLACDAVADYYHRKAANPAVLERATEIANVSMQAAIDALRRQQVQTMEMDSSSSDDDESTAVPAAAAAAAARPTQGGKVPRPSQTPMQTSGRVSAYPSPPPPTACKNCGSVLSREVRKARAACGCVGRFCQPKCATEAIPSFHGKECKKKGGKKQK